MNWKRALSALALGSLVTGAALPAAAQTGRITGVITDRTAGAPIPNVTVTVVGTQLGARSGPDGKYAIAEVPAGAQRVRAARIGYAPTDELVTLAAGQTVTVNIPMAAVSVTLDQMVVVGYGTQKRSDLTGSVASVTPNVEQTPVLSLEQTLQGAAPGVSVTQASSAPGGALSIRVRGGASVTGNNEPLYVIDGFPIENDPDGQNPSDGGRDATTTVPSNPMAAINPNDIESIEILKDASATSMYGARGANGVIIITTKHGSTTRPRFTVDSYTGTQSVAHRYDLLNGRQFADFANAWSALNGTGVIFANPSSVLNTDWQSLIFRDAPIRSMQVGVTGAAGASSATRYAISGGVFQQDGVVINSGFKRISMRGNLDQAVTDKLRLSSNITLSRALSNSIPTDGSLNAGAGAVGSAIDYYPVLPVRQSNGAYTLMSLNSPSSVLQAQSNLANPVSMANDVTDKLTDTRALANASGEYDVASGLKFRVSVGTDLSNRGRDTYYPRTTLMGSQVNGQAVRGATQTTNFLNENTLTYTKSLNAANQIDAIAGYSRQQSDLTNSTTRNSNFVNDIDVFESIGSGTQVGGPQVSSGHTRWTLASYIGRLNYTLLNRYLFTITARRDGSSRFGADHQWGVFPAVAFGWRVTDEPFMARFTAIELLKFRFSTGTAGNPSIRPYQSIAHLLSQQYTFGGNVVPGYYPASVANPNLGWESTRQNRLRRGPRTLGRPREPHRRRLPEEDRQPAARGQPAVRIRLRHRAAERRRGQQQRRRARRHAHRARFAKECVRLDDDVQLLAQPQQGPRSRQRRHTDFRQQREHRPQAARQPDSGRSAARRVLRLQDRRPAARFGVRGGVHRGGEAAVRHEVEPRRREARRRRTATARSRRPIARSSVTRTRRSPAAG